MTIKGMIGQNGVKGGVIVAELATPRIRPVTVPKERIPFKSTDESNEEFMKTYLSANNRSINYITHKPQGETFELELPVPDDLAGEYAVRLFGANRDGVAIGSATVTVTPKSVAGQGKRTK